jgi:hypothetical protein
MGFRSAHGAARARGETLVFESTPLDEIPNPAVTPAPIGRDSSGRFQGSEGGRRMAELRKHRPETVREIACTPGFAPFNRSRVRLFRKQIAELRERYGAVSAGAVAVLRGWAWLTVVAEFLNTRGAETGEPKFFEAAAQRGVQASVELAKAIELTVRDYQAREKARPIVFDEFMKPKFEPEPKTFTSAPAESEPLAGATVAIPRAPAPAPHAPRPKPDAPSIRQCDLERELGNTVRAMSPWREPLRRALEGGPDELGVLARLAREMKARGIDRAPNVRALIRERL